MIFDRLENLGKYIAVNKYVSDVTAFLRERDFSICSLGRQEIDGQNVYANLTKYKTQLPEEAVWEAHRKYIDIHCLIEGEEIIGFGDINKFEKTQEYDFYKDCIFFRGEGNYLTLRPSFFVLFEPIEVHSPGRANGEISEVKKLVFKLRC